jgi:thiol:disulfide interchange protein
VDRSGANTRQLVSMLAFVVLLMAAIGAFFWFQSGQPLMGLNAQPSEDAVRYQGLRKPTQKEMASLFPELQGKSYLIKFHSKYCLDCQKLAPVLNKVMASYPAVPVKVFDIGKDQQAFPAVFRVLEPATVPTLVFVRGDGSIQEVLYGFHSEATLKKQVSQLVGAVPAAATKPSQS